VLPTLHGGPLAALGDGTERLSFSVQKPDLNLVARLESQERPRLHVALLRVGSAALALLDDESEFFGLHGDSDHVANIILLDGLDLALLLPDLCPK
jgi:hypothetical protein